MQLDDLQRHQEESYQEWLNDNFEYDKTKYKFNDVENFTLDFISDSTWASKNIVRLENKLIKVQDLLDEFINNTLDEWVTEDRYCQGMHDDNERTQERDYQFSRGC
jgi:hypothetical protein